ncbi:MAG TPA: hypothetical protein PK486_06900, partial [Trichococcus flocculiformis]|nr:hypothetical protein [Trichococcus flocculiformis]
KSLSDLHLDRLDAEDIMEIARLSTKPEAPVHGLPYEVTAVLMAEAIQALDKYMANLPKL